MRTLDPAQEHTNEGRAQALTDAQHRLWVGKLPHRVGAKSRGPGDRGDGEHGDVKGMPWVGHLPGPNVTTGSSAGLSGLCCGQWGRLGSTGPYLVSWAGGQQHVTRASRATCGGAARAATPVTVEVPSGVTTTTTGNCSQDTSSLILLSSSGHKYQKSGNPSSSKLKSFLLILEQFRS